MRALPFPFAFPFPLFPDWAENDIVKSVINSPTAALFRIVLNFVFDTLAKVVPLFSKSFADDRPTGGRTLSRHLMRNNMRNNPKPRELT